MLRILESPEFPEDLQRLENRDLRRLAQFLVYEVAANADIKKKSLSWVKHVGDLRGCWAIKFDLLGFENRFRLVFEYLPNDIDPIEVIFWSVGPRFGYNVYRAAASRRFQ